MTPTSQSSVIALLNKMASIRELLPFAAGYVVSRYFDCRDLKDSDPEGSYNEKFRNHISGGISYLNEMIIFDTNKACRIAKQYLLYRHNTLKPSLIPELKENTCPCLGYFGITKWFSMEDLDLLETKGAEIADVIYHLTVICREKRFADYISDKTSSAPMPMEGSLL